MIPVVQNPSFTCKYVISLSWSWNPTSKFLSPNKHWNKLPTLVETKILTGELNKIMKTSLIYLKTDWQPSTIDNAGKGAGK